MWKDRKELAYLYWLLIGIFLFLFCYLFIKLFPMYGTVLSFIWRLLAPFIVACLIAYLLYPIVNKLQKYNIHRGIAILLIYFLFFGGITYLIYRVYPLIILQLRDLNEQLPQFIKLYEELIYKLYEYTSFLPETVHDKIDELILRSEKSIDKILTRLVGGFTKIIDTIIFLMVIPVLVFYFLKDYTKIKAYCKRLVPEKYRYQTGKMADAIDENLGNYIRGQLIVCLFVSIASFILFQLLNLKYALLLSIIMGITNLIPYFGPIIGAVPAAMVGFTLSGKLVIYVIIGVFIIQLIESNLLAPFIVGKSIQIHPVVIIFVLLLGGQLFGVVGMIVAVPTLTIIKVVVTHLRAFKSYN
ncbi:AI-2E family transporter [Virgibacillus halodenitrificans]|uniref:AI-2E family transporter n=1 Tax=Virgibacillus halodenitrificans TaxID=1482 RepID=UPI000EF4E1EB|nr:AI-2E family transporter [Virgibacillus halodenitrificans]